MSKKIPLLFATFFLIFPSSTFAVSVKVTLISEKCKVMAVTEKEITLTDGDQFTAKCELKNTINFSCKLENSDGKISFTRFENSEENKTVMYRNSDRNIILRLNLQNLKFQWQQMNTLAVIDGSALMLSKSCYGNISGSK